MTLQPVRLLWILLSFFASQAFGGERAPLELGIPLVGTADAAEKFLASARDAGKGYLIDLTTKGHEGLAFQSKAGWKLEPGRYRLHVFASASPGGNNIVDPVEIALSANKKQMRFAPNRIPKTGPAADLSLDFAVTADDPVAVSMRWVVGDSLLHPPNQAELTRQQFLDRRAGEILKGVAAKELESQKTDGPATTLGDDLGLNNDEKREMVVLAKTNQPKYRLSVAGVIAEKLSSVEIERVQTDKIAYEPGESVKVQIEFRNYSKAEEEVKFSADLRAEAPSAALPDTHQTAVIKVPAGGHITHSFSVIVPASAPRGLALTVGVSAACQDARPASASALFVTLPPKRENRPHEKKIFAHYMGCWPAGTGPIYLQRQNEGKELRHEARSGTAAYFGGHVRNFDLVDPAKQLTVEESADLEIRRAMRIGIDGFAIDAWAGQDSAKQTLDVLFKVAEAKNYPFEITICVDSTCGGDIVGSVKELLEKHGKSTKLARRDGKPLVFGYQSVWSSYNRLLKYAVESSGASEHFDEHLAEMRMTPLGWHIMGQALTEAAQRVGQPVFYHYCLSSFFLNTKPGKDSLPESAAILSQYADAVGGFSWLGPQQPDIAKAVRAGGAEWSMPIGMYQKENIPFECYVPKGTDWMHWGKAALEQDATLLQLITWNDYGENTCIAPAYNTRYTLYDLTGYEIKLWKDGKEPVPDHDRVYLIYRKYPPGAKIFPFHAKFDGVDGGVIEVLTILTKLAKIRLPGRDAEFDAPAGFFRKQFPVTAGPMIAELLRNEKVELRLTSPEPITDKPFREDNSFVCWSSEEERLWKEDFGAAPPFWYSEYGDADNDGLPNWFEMYWFSKERGFSPKVPENDLLGDKAPTRFSRWLDFSTATFADPAANPSGDGKTNLQHYRDQSDPTKPPKPGMPDNSGLGK